MTLEKNACASAIDAAQRYLGLHEPDVILEHHCAHAIPQYPVGYTKASHLGDNCSVNICIAAAKKFSATFLPEE